MSRPQIYENPVYFYGGDERDLVWLYLKDGTGYGVTDYWLVNGQMHFSLVEDDPTKPAEHAIPYDETGRPENDLREYAPGISNRVFATNRGSSI